MSVSEPAEQRGVLEPVAGRWRFTLELRPPAPDLAAIVARHWIVRWDVREPFTQEVLPHPCVNLAFEPGRPAVYGIPSRRFAREITGRGVAVGTRLRPGGLSTISAVEAATLTDRVTEVADVLGPGGMELQRAVLACGEDADARIATVEAWLRRTAAPPAREALLVQRVVDDMVGGPLGRAVPELAAAHGVTVRTLQRLFRRYVGVPPKWVLARNRIHEAAERMVLDPWLDLARLAFDLGYADHAHFSTDFRARTGRTPSAYLAACRDF